ncbi:hypothetical protein [Virgibacillus halodenitrificans]|uniref:hypothetical protein n=1 Tax=Virgibacillus halodenitrificans TaxID=1482 RepID=UPI00030D6FF2|nr:hypothetical protein [Virgibacillus halodenitrificans]
MTAEISILNRAGVALAADSAVTIGSKKVYNTANKLFALSKFHPVGIMIYGGANFMGVPWETIIKTYRKKIGSKKMDFLNTYMEDFLEHLYSDQRLQIPNGETAIVHRTFDEIINTVINRVQNIVDENLKDGIRVEESYVKEKLITYLEEEIINISNDYTEIVDINEEDFKSNFKDVINEIAKDKILLDYDQQTEELLIQLAYEAVRRDYLSLGYSGIVISGYGEEELFPCLYEIKIEGFIMGELKYILGSKCEISAAHNGEVSGAVIPFAQKEMVYSFMKGIDPVLNNTIENIINKVISNYPEIIQQNTNIEFDSGEVSELKELGKEIEKLIIDNIELYQQNNYTSPIIDIVDVLPKEELAEMAEALVNLTSFKRRVSIGTETVGGPIDVAIITKGDGLIWIKRKHYFEPNLNYTFFQNYQRSVENDNVIE